MLLSSFNLDPASVTHPQRKSSQTLIVRVENITKDYQLGKMSVPALKGVSLSVNRGDFLALSGPSGSGKTTLLNIIGCIERPTSGQIILEEQNVSELSPNQLADIRAHKISFIFQNFNILPVLNAVENVEYPLLKRKIPARERRERAEEALNQVGLGSFSHHKPLELSGGQRQRVAIARAIVGNPQLILADEPTANLDHKTGEEILDLMSALNKKNNTTFIFSTHDQKVVQRASRTEIMFDGLLQRNRQ